MSSKRRSMHHRRPWGEPLLLALVLLGLSLAATTTLAVLPPPIQAPFVHAGDPDDPGIWSINSDPGGAAPSVCVEPAGAEQDPAGDGPQGVLSTPQPVAPMFKHRAYSTTHLVWLYRAAVVMVLR